jgi:hypothetical protein
MLLSGREQLMGQSGDEGAGDWSIQDWGLAVLVKLISLNDS